MMIGKRIRNNFYLIMNVMYISLYYTYIIICIRFFVFYFFIFSRIYLNS